MGGGRAGAGGRLNHPNSREFQCFVSGTFLDSPWLRGSYSGRSFCSWSCWTRCCSEHSYLVILLNLFLIGLNSKLAKAELCVCFDFGCANGAAGGWGAWEGTEKENRPQENLLTFLHYPICTMLFVCVFFLGRKSVKSSSPLKKHFCNSHQIIWYLNCFAIQ